MPKLVIGTDSRDDWNAFKARLPKTITLNETFLYFIHYVASGTILVTASGLNWAGPR